MPDPSCKLKPLDIHRVPVLLVLLSYLLQQKRGMWIERPFLLRVPFLLPLHV